MSTCAVCIVSCVLKGNIEHLKQLLDGNSPHHLVLPVEPIWPNGIPLNTDTVEPTIVRWFESVEYSLPPSICAHHAMRYQKSWDDHYDLHSVEYFNHVIIPIYRFCLKFASVGSFELLVSTSELDPFLQIRCYIPKYCSNFSYHEPLCRKGEAMGVPAVDCVDENKPEHLGVLIKSHPEILTEKICEGECECDRQIENNYLIDYILTTPIVEDKTVFLPILIKHGVDLNNAPTGNFLDKLDKWDAQREDFTFIQHLIEHGLMDFQLANYSHSSIVQYFIIPVGCSGETLEISLGLIALIDSLGLANE